MNIIKKNVIVASGLLLASASICLQGCVVVAGAAAGAAAVMIVYDHQTISNSLADSTINNKIVEKMRVEDELHYDSHIEVTVFHKVVLLTGQTPRTQWRNLAERITKSVPGITRVYNQITVQGPTSTLTRTSDSWVTAKVRGLMLAKQDLKSGSIKVVTEDGTVYLMGVVTRQQAAIAADIARQVAGVQRVIRVFQYKD